MTFEAPVRCQECGATQEYGSCDDLFQTLLALDHSRQQPWGPLHALAVACFYLQHPTRLPSSANGTQRAIVQAYLGGGQPAMQALTERSRAGNSHRRAGAVPGDRVGDEGPQEPAIEVRGGAWDTTVADVAVDGEFPAAGYAERMGAWAESIERRIAASESTPPAATRTARPTSRESKSIPTGRAGSPKL